jgi:Lrp/AsnC family transcriptional regulator for asnA, asnC and gidA
MLSRLPAPVGTHFGRTGHRWLAGSAGEHYRFRVGNATSTWNRSRTAGTQLLSYRRSVQYRSQRCGRAGAVRYGRRRVAVIQRDEPGVDIHLDEVSRQIIEQLQQDGRRSYAAIAKVVGLSEAAVRQRVQKLLDAGVMQIVAVTDPLRVGFRRQAMIGLKAEGDLRRVADKLASVPEVDYVVMCAGSFDLLVELVCEDDEDLFRLINDRVRTVPGVRATESFVYLRLVKETYTWGAK